MYKIEIKNDMFDIVKRLKSIDNSYFVMYDKKFSRYELHSNDQVGSTYTLTIPYQNLDKRTIDYVLKTRRENYEKLIKEMELNNQKLEQKEMSNILDKAKYDLTDKLKYYSRH